MSALDDLIAAVEAGTLPEAVFHGLSSIRGHWAYTTGLDAEQRRWAYHSYNSSLDAAKALHEALLPGWWWVKPDGPDAGTIRVVGPDNGDCYPSAVGKSPIVARAWLLAILRAYRSLQE